MIKRCTDQYGFGCEESADLIDRADVSSKFRLVDTHSGSYYRNVCKKCEAMKQAEYRRNKKETSSYDTDDYGSFNIRSEGGSWIS